MDAMRTLRATDGALLTYCVSAPSSPHGVLVLLHGLASNHTRWSEFARDTTLRDRWTLLRPDLRGQGASTFRGRIGVADWCSDLAALLDAEAFPKAVVVGHCLGANLALAFAARHPSRIAGLVLVEPLPPEALSGTMRQLRRLQPVLQFVIPLVRALNALGVHRRAIPSLDLEQLDRETQAALARGPEGEAQLAKYASPLADLRTTALFGLWSLIPYAIYLLAVYWLSVRSGLASTLAWATVAWAASAAAILGVWSRAHPSAAS